MVWIWWDQLGLISYEPLQSNETISGERYHQQLIQHYTARSHVGKIVRRNFEDASIGYPTPSASIFIRRSLFPPLPVLVDDLWAHLAEQHFTSCEEAKNWIDS
ncbi:hypothetical protein RB195_008597 [Necator americanus]